MSNVDKDLKHQLKQAGASTKEVGDLTGIASSLSKLKGQSAHVQDHSRFKNRKRRLTLVPFGAFVLVGLVIGMALVILSQPVLPGSILYPIQKLSDNTAVSLNSDYRGTVMMKRAQQVKELVADNASASLVMSTLNNYTTEASAYKTTKDSYPAFEYCKDNLEQAANMANPALRKSIDSTLASLSET